MYVVTDTHPWVWFLAASPRLSQKAKSALSDPSNFIILPSIVMMEIKYLYQRKRIELSFLDITVVKKSPIDLDIHDAIIVGTTIQAAEEFKQKVSLVTKDEVITGSGIVPVIW